MFAQRLTSIDALRGVAALVVVLSHTVEHDAFISMAAEPQWLGIALDRLFSYGRVGVTLFFLISGFCIHLRWARAVSEGQAPRIGFRSFWKQRFTRLYPPFLVALGFYLAVQTWDGTIRWNSFDVYNLVSHLLMFHNFDERTIFSIEGVFWTLAIEEQLYLAYFLLLTLRKRWGWGPTLLICAGARLGWFGLAFVVNQSSSEFRLPHDGGSLAHWFVWALGALSVEAALGLITLPAWTSRMSMAFACFGAAIACDLVTQYHLFSGVGWRLCWLIAAPIWGVGLFVVVNRLVAAETYRPASDVMPRWITLFATLGLFSYSTYLMHHFVLLYLNPSLFRYLGIADSAATKILFLPLCYALCWLFFIAIERPCIIKKAHRMPTPAQTAVPISKLSPALS